MSLKSNQEEAVTRIILHALETRGGGYECGVVICRNTNVLVLLSHFRKHLSNEIWMHTGTSKDRRYISLQKVPGTAGKDMLTEGKVLLTAGNRPQSGC